MTGWPYVAGAGIVWTAIAVVISPVSSSSAARAAGWILIEGSPIVLRTGARYRGCLRVSWPLSSLVTRERILSRAAAEGFSHVAATEARPPGFPDSACDWYVEGVWTGAERRLPRPGQLPLAWQEASA